MLRRLWSEQVRITFWAWIATLGAAAMLAPLTESKRYLVVGAFGALVIATVGAVLRARRAHLILVLAAELVVGFEWTILMFARDNAVLGLLPGPDAISDLRDRWSSYADQANQYAAPLPENADVTMAMALVLLGLGIVVDIVAVSWRRAALLGLLFLAVYMTPVSILGGEISILAFLLGALGFVFLLAADERERLTHWGRQISTASSLWDRPAEVDEGGLRRNGTRVGLSAIALAAVLPVLIPTLSPHYFGQTGSGGPGGSGGDGSVSMDDPILDLRRNLGDQDPRVMLRVTTTDPQPKYFRLAALDHFTGNSWEATERDSDSAVPTGDGDSLPPPPGMDASVPTNLFDYNVDVTDALDSNWLPLVYAPATVEVESEWLVSPTHLDAFPADSGENANGLSYRFTADKPVPSEADMQRGDRAPSELMDFARLPEGLPAEFERVTRNVTDGARNQFEAAQAIESWFTDGRFDYSIEAEEISSNGIDDLTNFLTEDRIGYCEQFASAMAIMARTLDIPSRVIVGFLGPEHIEGNRWEFTGADMHAWPELYFEGAGWIRFEPTPQSPYTEGVSPPEFSEPDPRSTNTPTTDPTDNPTTREPNNANTAPADAEDGGDNDDAGAGIGRWWLAGAIPLGVALLAGLPRLVRAQVRRRRWTSAVDPVGTAETAWAELRDQVVDLRIEWDAGATPRAIGRSLRERLPDDRQHSGPVVAGLNRLVLAIEQARYARAIRSSEGLRDAVEAVGAALSNRQTGRQRFLARWLPISLLRTRGRRPQTRRERLGELLVSVED